MIFSLAAAPVYLGRRIDPVKGAQEEEGPQHSQEQESEQGWNNCGWNTPPNTGNIRQNIWSATSFFEEVTSKEKRNFKSQTEDQFRLKPIL